METTYEAPPQVRSTERLALGVGVVGLALAGVGAFLDPPHFYRGYLLGFMFWLGVALGCMALAMIHHLSGGAWGVVTRRLFEAASRTIPFMALLFVPIALGVHHLYVWTHPEHVAGDPILEHKAAYLNVPFFLVRAVFYFAVWSTLAYFLNRWSLEQDRRAEPRLALKLQRLSGGGLLVYALTITFAAVDWVMSLDPHWFSTIWGILFMGGQGLSALAFTIAVAVLLARTPPMSAVFSPSHFHDLGKLMLAFVMLWAYFSFSQFLIIWSANLPEEIPWYIERIQGPWRYLSLGVVLGHFALPFVLLLSRDLKRHARTLSYVAVFVIAMRLVDLFWLIAPSTTHGGHASASVHWLDVVAPIGLGGVFIALFLWQLRGRALLPIGEPYLRQALEHGRHGH